MTIKQKTKTNGDYFFFVPGRISNNCKCLDVQYGGYATETSRLVFKNVFKTLFIKKYMISIFPPMKVKSHTLQPVQTCKWAIYNFPYWMGYLPWCKTKFWPRIVHFGNNINGCILIWLAIRKIDIHLLTIY